MITGLSWMENNMYADLARGFLGLVAFLDFFTVVFSFAPVVVLDEYDYERKYDEEPSFCKHPDE